MRTRGGVRWSRGDDGETTEARRRRGAVRSGVADFIRDGVRVSEAYALTLSSVSGSGDELSGSSARRIVEMTPELGSVAEECVEVERPEDRGADGVCEHPLEAPETEWPVTAR